MSSNRVPDLRFALSQTTPPASAPQREQRFRDEVYRSVAKNPDNGDSVELVGVAVGASSSIVESTILLTAWDDGSEVAATVALGVEAGHRLWVQLGQAIAVLNASSSEHDETNEQEG